MGWSWPWSFVWSKTPAMVSFEAKEKRSSLSFGRCGKFARRFCEPFEILAKKGPLAYELEIRGI